MSEVLLVSMIEKMDVQERKLEELSERVRNIQDNTEILNIIKESAIVIREQLPKIYSLQVEVDDLTTMLKKAIDVLEHPHKNEVVHHHYASKVLWITAILFIIVCVLTTALYTSNKKLNLYKENDTKYRYLKLQADKNLYKKLEVTDSMYVANSEMGEIVIAWEEQNRRDFEMMQRALRMEREPDELKKKVNAKRDRREKYN
jgi:hypothetical protein